MPSRKEPIVGMRQQLSFRAREAQVVQIITFGGLGELHPIDERVHEYRSAYRCLNFLAAFFLFLRRRGK
jgi:hypothetical protein